MARWFIVKQDPVRRGIDVVQLAGANRPCKREHRHGCSGEREDEHEMHDGHGLLRVNARDRSELTSTVDELSGIIAAAISG